MTAEQHIDQPVEQPVDQPVTEEELYNALLRAKRSKRRGRYTFKLRGVRFTCDESYYEAFFSVHGYECKQASDRVSDWIVIGS